MEERQADAQAGDRGEEHVQARAGNGPDEPHGQQAVDIGVRVLERPGGTVLLGLDEFETEADEDAHEQPVPGAVPQARQRQQDERDAEGFSDLLRPGPAEGGLRGLPPEGGGDGGQ